MVLSDGMVHFLKIKKIFNKSTKTIFNQFRTSPEFSLAGVYGKFIL